MVGTDRLRQVVEALAAHEYAVGELYASYGQAFRREAELWNRLAAEERSHGDAIRSLGADDAQLATFADTTRFDLRQLVTDTRALKELAEAARYSKPSLREALQVAVELERSVAEARAFQVVASDDPGVAEVLDRLREQTMEHAERLRRKLASLDRS